MLTVQIASSYLYSFSVPLFWLFILI